MQIADEIGVKNLEAYGDSKLIINQVRGEYEVRHENLVPYNNATIHMTERFRNFCIDYVPHQQNAHADALASLAASLALPVGATEKVFVYNHDLYCPKLALENDQISEGNLQVKKTLETSAGPELRDLRFSYIDYTLYDILPNDPKEAAAIKKKALKFYYNAITKTLYRRSHDGILLLCLSHKEAHETLKEAHDGMCGAHQLDPKLRDRLQRLGYYWPKMIPDVIAYAKQCHAYQIHDDFIHQAPGHLRPTTSSWPFEMWGMDVVGPISPPSSKGHWFILAIADYFSIWVEAL